jgi:transposase
LSFCLPRLALTEPKRGEAMRCIGLDVHRDFCEVAIAEDGGVRLAGRVKTSPDELELFAASLAADDVVVLEATGNALAIVRIIEPHVARVVLAHPKAVKGLTQAGPKTDKIDARTLAKLLAGGFVPEVWAVDEPTRVLRRRIARRAQLVRQRTREKNQVHAILIRNLRERPPTSDLFGVAGREWLARQELPADEREMVEACLRQIDFLADEIACIDRALARLALASPAMRRLMTLPGISFITAAALMAAIGEIDRFPTSAQLVSYLGFDPRVRQSGSEPARHGRISKQGPGEARHLLVEAAWHAARTTGPLRAFAERIASRRGPQVAVVAVARKLVVIAWHMLTREEDYAFARPSLVREKLRRAELLIGAERRQGQRNPVRVFATNAQHRLEKQLAAQAEIAYRRLVQDWQPTVKKGASAAPGRASRGPSSGQAARQDTAPRPAP